MGITTIQLDESVKDKLDILKIHYRESYNDLLKRLISSNSPNKVDRESLTETIEVMSNPETMREIADALESYEKGNYTDFEDLKKELNLDV